MCDASAAGCAGLALVFAMLNGSLRLGADVTDNLQRLHLVVDANPSRHTQAGRCLDGSVPVQPAVPCTKENQSGT
jgi:hypothetical protein